MNTDLTQQERSRVTAAEWFAGGRRIPYDPGSARILSDDEAAATPDAIRVFERVAGTPDADAASEHPDLLATAIRDIATRHGVGAS